MDAIYEMAGFVLLGLITLGIVINISDIARTYLEGLGGHSTQKTRR
jgi:hypothetical protein